MKKIFFYILLLSNYLFGVNLLNYDIFDNSNTIDLTLAFDSSYKPNIYQSRDDNKFIITLKGVNSEEKYTNQLNSKIASEFIIMPSNGDTKIVFNNGKDLRVKALGGKDNLSLTLQISNIKISEHKLQPEDEKSISKTNTTKKNLDTKGFENTILMIVIGCFIFVVLLTIIKLLLSKKNKKTINQWEIFSSLNDGAEEKREFVKNKNINEKYTNDKRQIPKIAYFKQIADQKIVIISYNNENYLISFNNNDNLSNMFNGSIEEFKEFTKKNPRILIQTLSKKYSIDEYIKNASYNDEE